ncbi:cilia- and flagella-associated protein 206 isoform X2 [Prorops nasuta]|uniref:cilia- and flagella-associated protein 206 isoform X2 n=1 Tax=Prorops nasuta TaxID=863751 RepID=UPI0034D01AFE
MDSAKKNLIKSIIYKCKEDQISVTNDLVAFVFSLYQLNPSYQAKDDDQHNKKIIIAIIEKLSDEKRPSLVVLKSQLYFTRHYIEREEVIKNHRLCFHQKTGPLVSEICEKESIEGDRDAERLYQKILVVITLLSGLGNPTTPSILREVSVALQSIFQLSEIPYYTALSKREKEEQLMEMMCIVAGIRLFNKDCRRDGEGIDDLPSILKEAINRTHKIIIELLEEIMKKIYRFTSAVENAMNLQEFLPDNISDKDVDWAVEMLTACRQQEIYIRKLLADVECCDNEIKKLMMRLEDRLVKLHDTLRYRTAVPTTQVYPQFVDLADIWMSLQDEVIVLSHINSFLWEIYSLGTKGVNVYNQTLLNDMIRDAEVLTDAQRLERSMNNMISSCGECTLFYPSTPKDFENINLELLGFCIWSFVAGNGALIPGNPNNGIAKWKAKFYTFSSAEAAEKFGLNPDKYIHEALDHIRNHVEYIHLFQIYEDMEIIMFSERPMEDGPNPKIRHNQEVQTDTHILPPIIDQSYTWNAWELRRRALQLAAISKCATRSTQTIKSNFRIGVEVQASEMKDREVQTMRDNYANTKKLKTYIYGLRGRRDDCQHVVSFIEDEFEHL